MASSITSICAVLAALSTVVSASPVEARAAPFKPYGKKAGSAGGRAVPFLADHLGWWYDWTPTPGTKNGVHGISMLWGDGQNGPQDSKRFNEFKNLKSTPEYLLGFNEPDCTGEDTSANMSVKDGIHWWNELIVPKGEAGSLLGSPSMCRQKSEAWLSRFKEKLGEGKVKRDWDFTAIHVYKPNMKEVQADIDYYWNTFKKPIWITEFACVYDQDNFRACTDQGEINKWIQDAVDLFENNEHVMAYAYTDGGGLSKAWLPTNSQGTALSESGKTYLKAISKYG